MVFRLMMLILLGCSIPVLKGAAETADTADDGPCACEDLAEDLAAVQEQLGALQAEQAAQAVALAEALNMAEDAAATVAAVRASVDALEVGPAISWTHDEGIASGTSWTNLVQEEIELESDQRVLVVCQGLSTVLPGYLRIVLTNDDEARTSSEAMIAGGTAGAVVHGEDLPAGDWLITCQGRKTEGDSSWSWVGMATVIGEG